ncbi:MAG: SMI1/KNR4 family protein [Chloroflexota bacterium]
MWKKVISEVNPQVEFFPPVTVEQIDWAEEGVSMRLPFSLRSLYLETNGLSNKRDRDFLTWRLELLGERNAQFDEDCVRHIFFFAHAGDEIAFGFPIEKNCAVDRVTVYYPKTGELVHTDLPLAQFMVAYVGGDFEI